MWTIVLLAVAALVAILLAFLFAPADVSVEMERQRTLSVRLGLDWLFIRARGELPRGSRKEKPVKKKPSGRTRVPFRTVLAAVRVPGVPAAVRRLAARLASSVKVLEVSGNVRLGTGDPADTGRLWGLIAPLSLWCNRSPRVDVGVEPDFAGAGVTGTLGGTLRLYPARLVYGIVSTLFSMTAVRLLLVVVRSRPWTR